MQTPALTGLARCLAAPDRVGSAMALAGAWVDQEVTLTLAGIGPRAPPDLGAHVRRSFLGALGPAASAAARAGAPCPWDPPCALDVFCREQLRFGGDGLPKPYVLCLTRHGDDLAVTLRVFGMANDWFMAAAEALAAGIAGVLPWARVMPGLTGPPAVAGRRIGGHRIAPAMPEGAVTLHLLSPVDMSGENPAGPADLGVRLMSRLIRRVDAMARWHGVALDDAALRDLTAAAHRLRSVADATVRGRSHSPNRKRERRDDPTITGSITLAGDFTALGPILQMGVRCHLGRHATEGLGAFRVEVADV